MTSRIFRGFELLSSSIGWRVGWPYVMGVIHLGSTFVGVEFLQTFGFRAIRFDPGMLESQSGSLKTRILA